MITDAHGSKTPGDGMTVGRVGEQANCQQGARRPKGNPEFGALVAPNIFTSRHISRREPSKSSRRYRNFS